MTNVLYQLLQCGEFGALKIVALLLIVCSIWAQRTQRGGEATVLILLAGALAAF